MRLPHDAVVLVADGRKMLFFRNEGEADQPSLALIRQKSHPNPADRDQGTDEPGRTFSSNRGDSRTGGYGSTVGTARSAYEDTDFHQLEEDRFAAEAAEMLKDRAMAGEYEQLVVVAPPKTLGELRKHYHQEVSRRLLGEIAKDLTGHPVDRIEAALTAQAD